MQQNLKRELTDLIWNNNTAKSQSKMCKTNSVAEPSSTIKKYIRFSLSRFPEAFLYDFQSRQVQNEDEFSVHSFQRYKLLAHLPPEQTENNKCWKYRIIYQLTGSYHLDFQPKQASNTESFQISLKFSKKSFNLHALQTVRSVSQWRASMRKKCSISLLYRAVVQSLRNNVFIFVQTTKSMSTYVYAFFLVLLTIKLLWQVNCTIRSVQIRKRNTNNNSQITICAMQSRWD